MGLGWCVGYLTIPFKMVLKLFVWILLTPGPGESYEYLVKVVKVFH